MLWPVRSQMLQPHRVFCRPTVTSALIGARLRRKLVEGAEWAVCDALVGRMVFCAIYFGSTWVMLGLLGFDTVAGTSIYNLTSDLILRAKLTALGAGLVWGLLILAPAALLAWCVRTSIDASLDRMFTRQYVRPTVDALAVYVAMLVGIAVWNAPPPPGPPEFVVPGPEVYQAELAMIKLRIMALRCMEDATPAHCSRPDIRRIQVRYYLK
jgi:hypothetical protein